MSDVISTHDNPEAAAAAIQSLIAQDKAAAPEVPAPEPGFFRLPGGLVRTPIAAPDYDAEARELTGEDEEYIDRVRRGNPSKWFEATIERGIAQVGGEPLTKSDLRELLLGDAEQALLEIRISTYGDTLEYEGLQCPHCAEEFNLSLNLREDVKVTPLANSADRVFDVPLRKGGVAHVRLPRISDVPDGGQNYTGSEYNTVLLSRVVLSTEKDGQITAVAGSVDAARSLSVADRKAILTELGKRKVGPDLNGVKFVHDTCGEEVPFPLAVGDLFPDY